jgi:hypothetical protein
MNASLPFICGRHHISLTRVDRQTQDDYEFTTVICSENLGRIGRYDGWRMLLGGFEFSGGRTLRF